VVTARGWFLASVIGFAVVLGYAWIMLPADGVPLHFDASGRADRHGTRQDALLFLGLVGLALAAVMGWLARATVGGRLPTTYLKLPHKEYWTHPSREPTMRRLMAEDLHHIGAATMALLAVMGVVTVDAAGRDGSVYPWGLAAVVGYCVFVVGWMVRAHTTRYRPPEGA
jgi:hypothetical protein